MAKLKDFIKLNVVFVISFIAALVSCLFVMPDKEYLGYLDLRTLALLYCLMVVVAGLRRAGVFARLSHVLCQKSTNVRQISIILVLLCFFSAMLVTNDVALLTFVPFAVAVMVLIKHEEYLIWVVVLQTVAANLGSMLTPVGNPQNLYLYSYYDIPVKDFILITGPFWLIALVVVVALCMPLPKSSMSVDLGEQPIFRKNLFYLYLALFIVCLLVVFRIISWMILLGILIVTLLILDRKRLLDADFILLLTFVCFFVFSGNLARIPQINVLLKKAMDGREILVSALASQVISNVPAALLLSGFTDAGGKLLLGVNIGGLGTPVASLASLISLKLYTQSENPKTGKYMAVFLAVNIFLLVVLLILAAYIS